MKSFACILFSFAYIFITGCNNCQFVVDDFQPAVEQVLASRAHRPVVIDGVLDDEVWSRAKVYNLAVSADRVESRPLVEGACFQVAWDDDYLYLGAKLLDSDIIAQADQDQMHHYRFGDVCELFIKPDNATHYWELYVTPKGNKSVFFLPSRGWRNLPGAMNDEGFDLTIGAHIAGTLNDYSDRDDYWSAEMAIPIKALNDKGVELTPDQTWRILVARYNFSAYLTCMGPEHSGFPQLSATNFHLLEEYAELKLVE